VLHKDKAGQVRQQNPAPKSIGWQRMPKTKTSRLLCNDRSVNAIKAKLSDCSMRLLVFSPIHHTFPRLAALFHTLLLLGHKVTDNAVWVAVGVSPIPIGNHSLNGLARRMFIIHHYEVSIIANDKGRTKSHLQH